MKRWMFPGALALVLAGVACDNGDVQEGARSDCAEGGALTACPDADQTPEGVCWRMVDCAAIPLRSDKNGAFDWAACVDGISGLTEDRQTLVIQCIAASTCDALKVDGSPSAPNAGDEPCFQIGDQ
jgi:hypothetical protein